VRKPRRGGAHLDEHVPQSDLKRHPSSREAPVGGCEPADRLRNRQKRCACLVVICDLAVVGIVGGLGAMVGVLTNGTGDRFDQVSIRVTSRFWDVRIRAHGSGEFTVGTPASTSMRLTSG